MGAPPVSKMPTDGRSDSSLALLSIYFHPVKFAEFAKIVLLSLLLLFTFVHIFQDKL